jgi:hypothetical protein
MITPVAVAAVMDAVKMLSEVTSGYHKQLLDAGIPSDAAAEMTKEFHTRLLETALPGKSGKR